MAGAGNGSTDVEFWPAALAAKATAVVPVCSVGALNPEAVSVSAYSNTGSWVTSYRSGTAIVSTMPTTFNATFRGSLFQSSPSYPWRGTMDDDDYSCGFGLWSGTSFAAPAFAGDLAKALADQGQALRDDGDRVAHALSALAAVPLART